MSIPGYAGDTDPRAGHVDPPKIWVAKNLNT